MTPAEVCRARARRERRVVVFILGVVERRGRLVFVVVGVCPGSGYLG